MIKFKDATCALAVGLAVITAAAPALARHRADDAEALGISTARAEALRTCNAMANKFVQYTWGNTQSDHLRACMAEHGQPE